MKLAAEKNLNRYTFPVINLKGKQVTYPVEINYNDWGFGCSKGIFGSKNWMIMDILGTYVIHKMYNDVHEGRVEFKDRIPKSSDNRVKFVSGQCMSRELLKFVLDRQHEFSDGILPDFLYSDDSELIVNAKPDKRRIKKVTSIKVNDAYLKKQLSFLKKYTSVQLHNLIKQTAECKIIMKFPVRFFGGDNYQNIPYSNYNCQNNPSRFFSIVNTEEAKLSKHGHVLEREYEIRFDTLLGYFFIQNCLSCYTDLLPGKFYLMSDYAQLFYRMLILPYFNNVNNPIGINKIKKRLVLKTKDTYMVRKIVRRIMDELESNSFIKNPKEGKVNAEYAYSYVKNDWKEINNES